MGQAWQGNERSGAKGRTERKATTKGKMAETAKQTQQKTGEDRIGKRIG
jgi:hypothetical protein